MQLYPNPASSTFTLHLPGHTIAQATLLDMQGRETLIIPFSPGETVADVRHLPKGVYLVKATVDGGTYTQKIIIR